LTRPSRYGEEVFERYRQLGLWSEDTMVSLLEEQAARDPEAIAIRDSTTERSWVSLLEQARAVASGLSRLALKRGDPVVVQLPNWVESVVLRYALKMAGLIGIYAPITWREQEIRYVLGTTRARLMIAPRRFRSLDFGAMVARLRRDYPELSGVFVRGGDTGQDWKSLLAGETTSGLQPVLPTEVSMICLSSGTTGVPKLCESPEAAQLANGRGMAERLQITSRDTVGIFAPLDGGAGLMGWLIAVAAGCPVILGDDFEPESMLDRIAEGRVSLLATVPALLIRLLGVSDFSHWDLSALKLVRTGSAALTPATAREAEERLGARLVPAAGTMEVLTYAQTAPNDPPEIRLGGSVGRPLMCNEARVVSENGVSLSPGELGVLEVRGAGTGSGYFRDIAATMEAWGQLGWDGWFRTGDLAIIDPPGHIRLQGRTKDVISRGGRSVYPAELEALLMEHTGVRDVAVVGVESPALGECTRAYVVPRVNGELTEAELRDFLEGKRIATYKMPDEFRFLAELPRLPGKKVNRRALKAEV
jgi:non-ribosomal peptide synthetase component E (peptide arylation enzyme)